MALKPKEKYNPEKEHTTSVRSSNTENSAHPNSPMQLQSRAINDFPATVRPPPAEYNTSNYIPKFTAQVVSSLMDDNFKLNYEELKDKPIPFMLPPQWERPVDYQTMATRDGAIHSGQEDISTSDSESDHTGLEEVGIVYVQHISSSENLKLQGGLPDSDDGQSIEVEHWTPLLQSYCEGVYVFGNNRLAIMRGQSP